MDRFDPTRPDFSPYGFSCVRWTPTAMPRGDRHNEIELNLLEDGGLVYLMGGRKVVVPARQLTVFWAGVSHQIIEFECPTPYFVLTIPLASFLQWGLPDHFTQSILRGEIIVEPDERHLTLDRARFELWSEDVLAGSGERRHASLLEVEARLWRLALSAAASVPRRSRRNSPALDPRHSSRAEHMAGFIAQTYRQPLTAETIGQHVGLHPNYAMALFQRTFGTTLMKYLVQHRLSHAQRLLVTTRESIASIAFDSGFGSLSRFNEAFKASFDCTPREYRRVHQFV